MQRKRCQKKKSRVRTCCMGFNAVYSSLFASPLLFRVCVCMRVCSECGRDTQSVGETHTESEVGGRKRERERERASKRDAVSTPAARAHTHPHTDTHTHTHTPQVQRHILILHTLCSKSEPHTPRTAINKKTSKSQFLSS